MLEDDFFFSSVNHHICWNTKKVYHCCK